MDFKYAKIWVMAVYAVHGWPVSGLFAGRRF